jgi:gas vesicle protein
MFMQRLMLTIVVLSLLAAAGCKKSEPGTMQEQVKEDVNQAMKTTGEYLAQKKDAAIAQTRETYSKFEGQIQTFLSDLKNQSEEKWQTVKPDIEAKLEIAKQKLNDMNNAGSDKFGEAKKAFDDAMQDLKDTYEKAKNNVSQKVAPIEPNTSK